MSFAQLVSRIRCERNLGCDVPGFDPLNGNEGAKFLFLLEAPGPMAVKSGQVSFENPDHAAQNFRHQLDEAKIGRGEIAIWNIVPWYLGNETHTRIRAATGPDVQAGIAYLPPLLTAMPNLQCVVLVGAAARKAHIFLSRTTTARIVSCHHTSARAQMANPRAAKENIEVFRFIKYGTDAACG